MLAKWYSTPYTTASAIVKINEKNQRSMTHSMAPLEAGPHEPEDDKRHPRRDVESELFPVEFFLIAKAQG
jgi:hypothetical protein